MHSDNLMINADTLRHHAEHWYVLRVKSRCEKSVAAIAQAKDFEIFLPLCERRRRWSDREKLVEFPLFPGYIFCRIAPGKRFPLLTIPGAVQFVGLGKTPVPIDESEIAALQTAVHAGLLTEACPFLEIGERVRLEDGPLSGVEGIVIGDAKNQRIVISITLLRRSVAIAVERHWVAPASRRCRRQAHLEQVSI